MTTRLILLLCLMGFWGRDGIWAADAPTYSHTQDVVYDRLFGTALTLDVIAPKDHVNHAAVIWVVSGGWVSSHDLLTATTIDTFAGEFLTRGYTVFAVCHACQPKFAINEITPQINRAVRFIRYHAEEYKIDPNRIGITGGSAGGHLSMMQAVHPEPAKADAPDPVNRVSSEVEAVGCFFPPTDLLNYGKPGVRMRDDPAVNHLPIQSAFDYHYPDPKTRRFERVMDPTKIEEIERSISPIYFVSKDSAPALIIHGDSDVLVPLQQAQSIIEAYKKVEVPCKLIVRPGKGHGWADMSPDMKEIADWFDLYLVKADPKLADPAPSNPAPRN